MKPIALSLVAAVGALSLAACAEGGYGHRFGGGGYEAYYDDAYGPYVDGYWGGDDVFMYRRDRHGEFTRDEAHHFRHDNSSGFHGVHAGHGPPGGAHPSNGGDHRPG